MLRFVTHTSIPLRLCFGNRVSPWRGMNVQMCYRWDSLNSDLAHWYSLCTITAGSRETLTCIDTKMKNNNCNGKTQMHIS